MEYNKANEGSATIIKIKDGITVQIISIAVPWTTDFPEFAAFELAPKNNNVRTITTKTKKKINVIKNIRSWCKLMIPNITGVAASWKQSCQEADESNKIENINRNE